MGKYQELYPFNAVLSGSNTIFSEVHRARSKKTGALVALKKIIMHNEKDGVSAPLQEPLILGFSDNCLVPYYGSSGNQAAEAPLAQEHSTARGHGG